MSLSHLEDYTCLLIPFRSKIFTLELEGVCANMTQLHQRFSRLFRTFILVSFKEESELEFLKSLLGLGTEEE